MRLLVLLLSLLLSHPVQAQTIPFAFVKMGGCSAALAAPLPEGLTHWTPARLPYLALWLDADDISTITLNGSNVSQWRDKSGNNRHATQTTDSKQPRFEPNLENGRSLIFWDGSDGMIISGGAVPLHNALAGSNNHSVTMVIKPSSISNHPVLIHSPLSTWQFLLESHSNGGLYWGYVSGVFRTYAAASFFSRGSLSFFTVVKTGTSSGDAFHGGTLRSSFSGSFGATPAAMAAFLLGEHATSAYNYTGRFGEIVISSISLATADRQKLEGYIAHKWCLVDGLPSDHPYKEAPPYVPAGCAAENDSFEDPTLPGWTIISGDVQSNTSIVSHGARSVRLVTTADDSSVGSLSKSFDLSGCARVLIDAYTAGGPSTFEARVGTETKTIVANTAEWRTYEFSGPFSGFTEIALRYPFSPDNYPLGQFDHLRFTDTPAGSCEVYGGFIIEGPVAGELFGCYNDMAMAAFNGTCAAGTISGVSTIAHCIAGPAQGRFAKSIGDCSCPTP